MMLMLPFSLTRMRIFGIFAGLVVVLGAALALWHFVSADRFADALSDIAECVNPDGAMPCAKPAVVHALELEDGATVMREMAGRLPPKQCHYAGHIVGQRLVRTTGDMESVSESCGRACDSACQHGAVAESFAQALGYEDGEAALDINLGELDDKELRQIASRLCSTRQACHGVGHVLLQVYQDIDTATLRCREIARENTAYYCYQGVFMENADILANTGMWEIPGYTPPTLDELRVLCDREVPDEQRMCFRSFPRLVKTALRADSVSEADAIMEVHRICESKTEPESRIACFSGIGAYSSYAIPEDRHAEGIATCEAFPSPRDKVSCYLGQVSVAPVDRKEKLIEYCRGVPDEKLRSACYQASFFFIYKAGGVMDDLDALCTEDDTLCTEAFRIHRDDAWERVSQDFTE